VRAAALVRDGIGRWARPRWLPHIVLLSVALRVAAAVVLGNEVTEQPGIADQLSYHALALRVVDGWGFTFAEGHWPATAAGEPTAHWSFLYTLYLAAVYAAVGAQPLVARLLQAVAVGVLHPWLAWRVGQRVFGPRAGMLAAVFSAVYGYFIYYAGGLLTEAFYFVGILWTLDAATRLAVRSRLDDRQGDDPRDRSRAAWVELGVAIGVTGLLRQVFLVFAPVLAAWLFWVTAGPRPRLTWARARTASVGVAIAAATAMLLVVPWTVRNYRAFGAFVPLNTNAGFALYWGNHPAHGTEFVPLFNGQTYGTLIPDELRGLNEAALDRALLERAIDEITRDPWRYLQLSASRVREYVRFWPSGESGALSNAVRVLSFGVFLPFMVFGAALAVVKVPRGPRTAGIPGASLLGLFVVVYTGIHLATWTLIRYRLPVDVVLLLFAAFGVAHLALDDRPSPPARDREP
jgi:hypothetical protein